VPSRSAAPGLRCTAASLAAAGCAAVTYPAPGLPAGVDTAPAATAAPFAGVEALCDHGLRGATRQVVAFRLERDIGLCFSTPIMGSRVAPGNPSLTFDQPCQRGPVGGVRGGSGRLIFRMFIGARDAALAVDQAVATLEVEGRTLAATPEVMTRQFLDMPPGILRDGTLRYPVGESWLTFAQAVPYYSRPGYALAFGFATRCDPDAHYRLTVQGISADHHALPIPAIDYAPASDRVTPLD